MTGAGDIAVGVAVRWLKYAGTSHKPDKCGAQACSQLHHLPLRVCVCVCVCNGVCHRHSMMGREREGRFAHMSCDQWQLINVSCLDANLARNVLSATRKSRRRSRRGRGKSRNKNNKNKKENRREEKTQLTNNSKVIDDAPDMVTHINARKWGTRRCR